MESSGEESDRTDRVSGRCTQSEREKLTEPEPIAEEATVRGGKRERKDGGMDGGEGATDARESFREE